MKTLVGLALGLLATLALGIGATADEKDKEKDIFNYAAQKGAGKDVKKIVFVGDKRPHGPRGNHEFVAGPMLMARTLNAAYPNVYAVVHTHDKFPTDLSHADSVIILINNGGPAVNPAVEAAM